MIDNYAQMRSLLKFENKGDFYFLQILKRRKDNPEMDRDMVVIKNFYIDGLTQFDNLEPIVKDICKDNNARAYLRLNRRNFERVAVRTLRNIAELMETHNYANIKSAYDHACGDQCSEKPKTWIIDVDTKDGVELEDTIRLVTEYLVKAGRDPIVELVTTPNGYHILAKGFNLREFREAYNATGRIMGPNMIHKDNPTILYVP